MAIEKEKLELAKEEMARLEAQREEYKNFDKKIINKYLFEILGSNNLFSKESIYRKYDHHVQTNTVVEPGSDAAVIRIKGTDKYLIFSCDGNSRFS